MTRKKRYFIKYLLSVLIIFSLFSYLIAYYGLAKGLQLSLMTWSFYILFFPAAHGQYLFGYPLHFVTTKKIHTEPFLLLLAALLNVGYYWIWPALYAKTYITYFLFRALCRPNPYYLVIACAAIGTLFNTFIKQRAFTPLPYKFKTIRAIIFVAGITSFLYFAHLDIILLFNAII